MEDLEKKVAQDAEAEETGTAVETPIEATQDILPVVPAGAELENEEPASLDVPLAPAEPAAEGGKADEDGGYYEMKGEPRPGPVPQETGKVKTDLVPPKPPKSEEQIAWERAKKEHFQKHYWQPWLRPIVALVSICIVTSLLLGLTNALTQPVIAQNAANAAEQSRMELLPEADTFEEVPVPENLSNVTSIYKAANGAGWVIEAYGRGYGGKVPAMVAFDQSGTIVGVVFPENSETVGLGQKVREAWFGAQFVGRANQQMTLSDIDRIASATVSSGAAVNAINAAIEAYNTLTGSAGPSTPEEVREALLPGAQLTEITIDAPGVQATAWRSDSGDYIIYGEKPSEREGSDSVVVAAVAMNADGVILNLWIDTSGESDAYGALLPQNQAFLDSFIGMSAPVQVDVVAGVTNSSNSVMTAVNNALNALPIAKEAG